jgi:hypothetical protein
MDDDAFDGLLAQGLVQHAFMAEVIRELAKSTADPKEWTAAFMLRLHARIDRSEGDANLGQDEFELARSAARDDLRLVEAELSGP